MLKRKPIKLLVERILLFSFLVTGSQIMAIPVASFTADQTTGCNPLNVQFTSTSTGAVSWYWNLGNGNTSTLPNPSNLYTAPGNYTVTLIVKDSGGNTDTAQYQNYISVVGRPVANFIVDKNSACPDNNLFSFTNTSTGSATSFLWDFGDGSTSTLPNPDHSFTFEGIFTVTLIAMNGQGCQDIKIINQYITIFPKPDASFSVSDTMSCDPTTPFHFTNTTQNGLTWNWHFGDQTSSTLQNPTHVFHNQGTYQTSVIVTNTHGCKDTSDSPVRITVGLNNWADFSNTTDSGCAPLTVQFANTNLNVATSFWTFGDGSTSTSSILPTNTYTNGGTYSVSLIVTTLNGCVDTVTKNNLIKVGAEPVVDFTYSNTIGCAPLSVQFTNNSSNFISCQWFFGDGTTSTAINPTHVYNNSGSYSVTLQCRGASGCTNSKIYNNIVNITAPHIQFTGSSRVGCPPLLSSFTSLTPSGGLTYLWNFGDGSTSALPNPSHNYILSGTFDVSLTVTDTTGCSTTITKDNFVQTVNPAANYIPPPTTSGCAPLTTQFTDASSGASAWNWDFGDGTTSILQNPTHTYSTPGLYTVSLMTESSAGGCATTINNFSTYQVNGGYAGFTHTDSPCPPYISAFQDTSSNAVSWFWDFGDGTTSTSQNPTHTYLTPGYHSVSLNIMTADSCSYTTMQNNIVYFAPFGANFFGVPLDTIFPVPVQFYANSVGATSWLWNFGDGSSSTLRDPLHTYQTNGAYGVTLTISNGTCTLFYDPPPYIFGVPDTTPIDTGDPEIIEVQQGCSPLNVLFTNKVKHAAVWHWDFGDGDTSNIEFPFHIYDTPGYYSVTLTTIDTIGIVNVLQMDSIVHVYGPLPGFVITQTTNCLNTAVSILDTSLYASSWSWNFGDGTIDSIQNPSHTYNSTLPNFVITQTVRDTMGCSASISTSIFSNLASPVLASESELCGYDTVYFFTSLQNFASYVWDFGDGQTSNLQNPSHVFMTEGNYPVSVTVTDYNGCTQTFYIYPSISVKLPIANFTTTGPRHGCNSLDVEFYNLSQNADSYQWSFGDGNYTSQVIPVHTYSQAGIYDVTLTVFRGACQNTVTFQKYVRVDTAHAEFTFATDKICLPVTASFYDLSVNPVSWHWQFGDGASSHIQNPIHAYTAVLCCFPLLIMTDINGCTDSVYSSSFPLLHANFTTSADSGCFPFAVQFNNSSSALADHWYWDFGDGTTSTLQNPSHTYSQPGTYSVMLIVESAWAVNCIDTIYYQDRIIVRAPHADFSSLDLKACAPSIVNFTNTSVDADIFLWDFGDGSTSTNVNPSHIYNTPGIYDVKLISSSSLGCADSLFLPQFITVLGPATRFTASSYQGCSPLEVSFTNQSINATAYSWNFGDGYADTLLNPVHVFRDSGSFTVSLVSIDTSGCTSFFELPQPVEVLPAPAGSFTVSSNSGCLPLRTTFTNTSTGYHNFIWDFGDGITSSAVSPVYDYVIAGVYDASLILTNQFGCTDTAKLDQPVEALETPIPHFTVNDAIGCIPFHVTFVNSSTNLEGPQYLWNFGNGNTSNLANPFFDYSLPGTYNISLTIMNSNGCMSTATYPSMLHVPDTIPPNETKILSVSVLSNTSVKIIWENNPAIDLASYVIYRNDPLFNVFRPIYTETNVQNTNFALTSEYVDTGLNTLSNTYTYKVLALDTCASSIPLDRLTAHTTINVSSVLSGNNIRVSWTPYKGCPVSSYQLFRAAPGEPFSYLETLPADSLKYIDTTFICPVPYTYKIMATDLCGNTYTSYSDTSITIPINILNGQIVDVVRSTVVEDLSVLTEWGQPEVHPEKVAQFDIYRSTDNINFYYLESVPSIQTDYMDYNVDVQKDHYYYKILVINTCDIDAVLSGITSTIILNGEMDESRQVQLNWTPYLGWENGVEYYIVEKRDENGNWQLLRQVNGNVLKYEYQGN